MARHAPWAVHFFKRHPSDDPEESVPARQFLDECPDLVAAKLIAVVKAVADAPPPQFSGGGKWEAMHGEMNGVYEVRADGPKRRHYRLFCVLQQPGPDTGLTKPAIVLISGASTAFRTKLTAADYRRIKALVDEYARRKPRSLEP